jgi:actin-related protein
MSSETVLVVDIGSASLKAGYAGEDTPATIIPSIPHKYPHGLEVTDTFSQEFHSLSCSQLKISNKINMINQNTQFAVDK